MVEEMYEDVWGCRKYPQVLGDSMKKWKAELTSRTQKLGTVRIRRDISEKDCL